MVHWPVEVEDLAAGSETSYYRRLPVGPAPINSEKRPQADTSLSRPVWPQFCFYPLRIIPQGTQSQGLRMRSDFGGVKNSMFLGHVEIYKSGGASGKSHLVLLWAPPQVKSSKFMYTNG